MTPSAPAATPLTPPPPLPFVLVWNGFISLHAYFMLGAGWPLPALFGMLLFYSIFFAVGGFMIVIWVRHQRLRQRFGQPVMEPPGALLPGRPGLLSVQFDRTWPPDRKLEGSLHWVSRQAGRGVPASLQAIPLPGNTYSGRDGTHWSASLSAPPLPAGVRPEAVGLELRLHLSGLDKSGWRFPLAWATDAAASPGALADRPNRLPVSAAEREKLLGILGKAPSVLAAVAVLMLALMCRDGRLDFTDLLVPLFLLIGGWHVRDVQRQLEQWRDWSQLPDSDSPLHGLKQRFRYTAIVAPVLMIGLFAADILLPDDVIGTLRQLASSGVERAETPVIEQRQP